MWHYLPESDTKHCSLEDDSKPDGSRDVVMLSDEDPPTFEQGFLFADALNVHEATRLTPSQLQARVAELEAALADEREKSAFWAEKAHEMRGQALRGEPVDGIIQP